MDVEKYKEYIVSFYMPEYEAQYSDRILAVEGWKLLLDEVFSPLIEKELGMRYLGNRIWADDYDGHRRRVLSLFQPTDLGGCFRWGWNYDFVPKMVGGKAVYARTDKTIFAHFYENAFENHNRNDERFKKSPDMFFYRYTIDIDDYEESMKSKVKEHTNAFYKTLPLIRAFYEETSTYEQTIEMLDVLLESDYYGLLQGNYLYLTKLFLQQYVDPEEENEKALLKMFESEITRKSFHGKFKKIPVKPE